MVQHAIRGQKRGKICGQKKSPTDAGLFLQLACAENTLYTL
jgi:hypothetical protein